MKSKYIYSVLFTVALVFVFTTAFRGEEPEGEEKWNNKDVIKFSHEFHVNIFECQDCHLGIAETTSLDGLNLPTMDDCGTCHDIEDEDNCTRCHYEDNYYEYAEEEKEELYFNHKAHMDYDDLECETCHMGLDKVEYSFEAPNGAVPPMNVCSDCHAPTQVASNECSSCHIGTVDLLPVDHKTAAFPDNHKFLAKDGDAECQVCHDEATFCEACHAATNGLKDADNHADYYAAYAPHNYVDDTKQQKIMRVHDLNYKFSHGIEARNKSSQCQSCHEVKTFCNECHGAEDGDFALGGVTPSTHFVNNFVTIGVGSGGGQHADMARRDIESCASCHDTYGGDPNCILCHTDADGIKGTNPKTHKTGFMRDTDGDWHNDMGAVCYNCHTDANARPSGQPGLGFCGYCHGGNVD